MDGVEVALAVVVEVGADQPAHGHTDEAIAKRLEVSQRTARRIATDLMEFRKHPSAQPGGPPAASIRAMHKIKTVTGPQPMTGTATRYLYLTRHGQATPDENGLTDNGRRQAVLLGERLRGIPLSAIHHGPLARAEQTARLIGEQLNNVRLHLSEPAGDYIPYLPHKAELPPDAADAMLRHLAQFPPEERERGPALAVEALAQFTGPVKGDEPRHELVVTHNFLIGWLIRAAHDAPPWRWMGLNHCNAALTVIRYTPGRPSAMLFYNDMRHLPVELRWTGFPPEFRV